MGKKLNANIVEMESKINILERENEILSAKVEENLLLNRAFEEINNFDDGENLLINTLESISILLDIQFVGIFDLNVNQFKCISSYILFLNEDTVNVRLKVSDKIFPAILSKETCHLKNSEVKLVFEDPSINFPASHVVIIPVNSVIEENKYFVFANDTSGSELKARIPLLEKVIQIISAKRERIFYQNELNKLNKKLKSRNKTLEKTNEIFSEKNQIINEQNVKLKAAMQDLRDTQAHLVHSEKMASLGILTAGVAHEINNPLNYILGAYVGLEKYFMQTGQIENEKISKLLEIIKTGVDRTAGIVKSLNQFSREKENFNETCDINSILDNCLVMINSQLKHRVELIKKFTAENYSMPGNVGKLYQVFLNVLINASQAIQNEGVISIMTYIKDQSIMVKIVDSGCGISEKHLSKITDPFFTTKDPDKGTGLGLSIAYGIVADHGGKIEFKSELNKGTEVLISLPLDND